MRTNHLLSLIVSGGITVGMGIWVLRQSPGTIGIVAFAGVGLWFALCLIRFLGQNLARPAPDFTEGRGFGRIPSGSTSAMQRKAASPGHSAASVADDDTDKDQLVSLVLLLSEAREPTVESISRCVSTALDIELDPDDQHATQFVIRMPTPTEKIHHKGNVERFMIKVDVGVFAVLSSTQPYMTNRHAAARRDIRDKRLRTAIEEHRAWISVDLMGEPGSREEKKTAYRSISLMLAAMTGPDCVAICCPERQLCNEFDPGLIELLRSDDPLSLFDDPTFAPVIEVSNDDPKLQAAVEKALQRWPEFIKARSAADADDTRFLAKAEFTDGEDSEFMWVQVAHADERGIEGLLVNEPHELDHVHCGQAVTVDIEKLNDWIYPGKNGNMIGGFTLDIIASGDSDSDSDDD